jgi:putative FmdB family regulatory protein
MPLYTYRCESCGVQFDRKQQFSDKPLTRCPECGKRKLRKLYQPVGIVFKGSGFYSTDHRSPSGQTKSSTPETSESRTSEKKENPKKAEATSGDD